MTRREGERKASLSINRIEKSAFRLRLVQTWCPIPSHVIRLLPAS
jgi:hypothetical protein